MLNPHLSYPNPNIAYPHRTLPQTMSPAPRLTAALAAIDAAHAEDPTTITIADTPIPYELHYAQQMTVFLHRLSPSPPDTLQLAVRAQHLRRWEVPRASYPMTRPGYFAWRTGLKKRQAEMAVEICLAAGYSAEEAARVGALVRKEGLKVDGETQVLEDAACLVFLDDQFAAFREGVDEGKMVGILRKTWGKMGEGGRRLALEMRMDEKCKALVAEALGGQPVGERGDVKMDAGGAMKET